MQCDHGEYLACRRFELESEDLGEMAAGERTLVSEEKQLADGAFDPYMLYYTRVDDL